MYNLLINGKRVTNLRLSGPTVAGIFTNKITMWNDPAIKADNPGLDLPALQIIPVVRSDGSGATSDFTQWMLATDPSAWQAYCKVVGRNPCTQTSTYPPQPGTAMKAQAGDPGVATYVAQSSSDGAIGYVEYSWALTEQFPVAKLLNAAGYYTLPSPGHVAVSLLADQVNTSNPNDPSTYLTQNLAGVYTNKDPRNYELSAYSYFILPTDLKDGMTRQQGLHDRHLRHLRALPRAGPGGPARLLRAAHQPRERRLRAVAEGPRVNRADREHRRHRLVPQPDVLHQRRQHTGRA